MQQTRTIEEIAYLKLWLGILLVTTLSLGGWIMTHATQSLSFLVVSSIVGFIAAAWACASLHRRIVFEIKRLED
ncbi:MAG: hypothetical protein CMP08_01070 [Xanthomonadales bacterium]|nr:hypothetical protein [Xanthomonadales bacterium]|tara:strand:+ start:68 stop:289 length:222 start_codon:yes stop_codon:yes gene_type:complete